MLDRVSKKCQRVICDYDCQCESILLPSKLRQRTGILLYIKSVYKPSHPNYRIFCLFYNWMLTLTAQCFSFSLYSFKISLEKSKTYSTIEQFNLASGKCRIISPMYLCPGHRSQS